MLAQPVKSTYFQKGLNRKTSSELRNKQVLKSDWMNDFLSPSLHLSIGLLRWRVLPGHRGRSRRTQLEPHQNGPTGPGLPLPADGPLGGHGDDQYPGTQEVRRRSGGSSSFSQTTGQFFCFKQIATTDRISFFPFILLTWSQDFFKTHNYS